MASSGLDGRLKVWDLRTYKMVHSYALRTPATAIDISQRGLMGVTCCGRVQIWKDALAVKASAPYLEHSLPAGAQVRANVLLGWRTRALIPTPFVSTGTSPAISTIRRFLGHRPLKRGQLDCGARRGRAQLRRSRGKPVRVEATASRGRGGISAGQTRTRNYHARARCWHCRSRGACAFRLPRRRTPRITHPCKLCTVPPRAARRAPERAKGAL